MNPMLGTLNQSRMGNLLSQIQPIKQTMNMVRAAQNPQMMLNQVLSRNPNYQQLNKLIQDNGGDAQKAFYSLANQMGIDPNSVLDALK